MNYRCPICNGSGKVESTFGGAGDPYGAKLTCPGCNGTGMQWMNESTTYPQQTTTIIRKQCRKQPHDFFRWK